MVYRRGAYRILVGYVREGDHLEGLGVGWGNKNYNGS